jgi:cell division protein FtsI/penicillin-binding protein 2
MVFFGVLFSLIAFRLVQIQVFGHGKYRALAEDQYWTVSELKARRGTIYSADNRILAGTVVNYLLFGEPNRIDNPEQTADQLAEIISQLSYSTQQTSPSQEEYKTRGEFYEEYKTAYTDQLKKDLYWVPLAHDIPLKTKEEIEATDIKHIGFEEEPSRFYPEGTLLAHVLGFVAGDEEGTTTGYFGIEGSLDEELRGKPGKVMEERDAMGNPILVGGYRKVEPVQGRDVILTIDSAVQYIVEKKLKEGVEYYNAKSGTVIVMDPFTAEIVALANYPTYSPAEFYIEDKAGEDAHRKTVEKRNLAMAIYEPGSIMKPITVSAAIDSRTVTPETTFEDNGPVQYSDYVINNWDGAHHGTQTIVQLLQKSNNIGAAWVGHQVGAKNIYKYFTGFGIGEKTGISLEGEDTGTIRDYKTWTDIDLATISFGQGVSASPLQMINAFNTIANGGYLLKPKIISQIIDGDKTIDIPTKNLGRVISEKTSETMIWMLEEAVVGGEAKYFVLKDYKTAGKTGTAQIPEKGKYAADRTNATFVGFLSGDQKISMIVKLEEPRESIYAAETAVPLWMDIVTELVKYYGIAPDRQNIQEE